MKVHIKRLTHSEKVPMELLLLADPSELMINKYLPESDIYIAQLDSLTVGVFVLSSISAQEIELKNIAVHIEYRRNRIGTEMMKYAIRISKMEGFKQLIVKTADASLTQQAFYKKLKFKESLRVKGYFIKYYEEPIMENGTQAIDQIVLTRSL